MLAETANVEEFTARTRPRLVLADDDQLVLILLAAQLGSAFECVGTAVDAQEAVALVETHTPDVAILDLKMPGGGGVRATREIRARSPKTAIVILSAGETREGIIELMRLGAVTFVHKGIDAATLIGKLDAAIEAHRAIAAGASSPPSRPSAHSYDYGLHGRVAHELVDALNRGDGDALISLFHPVAEFRPERLMGPRRVFEGHEGIRRYADELNLGTIEQQFLVREIRSVSAEQFIVLADVLVEDEVVCIGTVLVLLAAGKIIEATVYLSEAKTLTAPD